MRMPWASWADKRRAARNAKRVSTAVDVARAMYKAAESSRLTGSWQPVNEDVNDVIAASSSAVRARVRQLIRDFPYFARAVDVLVDYVVGDGIMLQARPRGRDGNVIRESARQIEDAWKWWCDEADISGRLHFHQIQRLCQRQLHESGEFFAIKHVVKGNRIPFALQIIEADWLDSSVTGRGKNPVEQGIELDPLTGRPLTYFVQSDWGGKSTPIPAERVIHGFKSLRPGQVRGISDFVTGVLLANFLSDYMNSEIQGARMAAKWLAFVTKTMPMDFGSGLPGMEKKDGKIIETLEDGVIDYLQPGENITLASHNRPNANMPAFVRLMLCMMSAATGAPYELLSGDYGGLSYATMRVGRLDFAQALRPRQDFHSWALCRPVFRAVMDMATLSGAVRVAGLADPMELYRAEWQPSAMAGVDELRDAKARLTDLQSNLRSPQEIAAARGRDIEEIYQEIAAARDLASEYGLPAQSSAAPSTSVANNPAAVEGQP